VAKVKCTATINSSIPLRIWRTRWGYSNFLNGETWNRNNLPLCWRARPVAAAKTPGRSITGKTWHLRLPFNRRVKREKAKATGYTRIQVNQPPYQLIYKYTETRENEMKYFGAPGRLGAFDRSRRIGKLILPERAIRQVFEKLKQPTLSPRV
jgi:hypothetical protein